MMWRCALTRELGERRRAAFGVAFIVVGVAFKFGAVPFHMWIPDVYHGAPTSVTLFLGSAPKIASFALAIRVLAEGLAATGRRWSDMLTVLAVLSMALGNVVAIAQTNHQAHARVLDHLARRASSCSASSRARSRVTRRRCSTRSPT